MIYIYHTGDDTVLKHYSFKESLSMMIIVPINNKTTS